MTGLEISCRELVELVSDYLEGRLTVEDADRVEAHLAICPHCEVYLDQIRTVLRLGGEERQRELPPLVEPLLPAFRSFRRGLT